MRFACAEDVRRINNWTEKKREGGEGCVLSILKFVLSRKMKGLVGE